MAFVKASKSKAKARIALCGPSGAGKTFTSLKLASAMGEKVAVIDTERGSASKYADLFEFDVMELENFHPQQYINGIKEAEAAGYDVLVIDSLSHAWMGKDGALELVDKAATRSKSGNSFSAWREVTPIHNALVDAILQSKLHVIVTMRAKTEYVMESVNGKQVPRKIGMAPVQRDGMEYEFDIVGDLDFDNNLIITKTRCHKLSGAVINKPGEETAQTIKDWLSDGIDKPQKPDNVTQLIYGDSDKQRLDALKELGEWAKGKGIEGDVLRAYGPSQDIRTWTVKDCQTVREAIEKEFAPGDQQITDEELNDLAANL